MPARFRSFPSWGASTLLALTALTQPTCRTMEETEEEPPFMDQPTFAVADADGDGAHAPDELARHLHREALAEFDLDADGTISDEEWAATKPSADIDDERFHRLDGNGDGRLTEEEAVSFITENDRFRKRFQRLDANEDGHLYWEEYATADPEAARFTLFPPEETPKTRTAPQEPATGTE